MISGGKVDRTKPTDLASEFIRTISNYSPTLKGVQTIAKKAMEVGLPRLRQACVALQKIERQKPFSVGLRHAPAAPKSFYPADRAEALGKLFCDLWDPKREGGVESRAFATSAAVSWIKEVAKAIGIEYKYDNRPKK